MAFNFPASPSNGQTYTPVGGPVFTWDGTAWKALSQGMPVTVFVADTPPAAPSFGNLWWESDTGNLYIYYNDGDSAQWVQVNGTPAGYQTADTRNRVVNGAMQISQEVGGGGAFVAANAGYAVDQWQSMFTAPAVLNTRQYIDPAFSSNSYRYRAQVTTIDATLAGGDSVYILQSIEGSRIVDFGYGQSYAKQAILRFGFRGPAGTYVARIGNYDHTRSWLAPFTVPVTDVETTQTFVVPGDVTGTWPTDSSGSMRLCIVLAASATLNGVAGWNAGSAWGLPGMSNGVGTLNAVYHLWNVGLYLDPDNTGVAPKWEMPDEAEELRACQRYWWATDGASSTSAGRWAGNASAQYDAGTISFPTTMRTQPAGSNVIVPTLTNCSTPALTIAAANDACLRVTTLAVGFYHAKAGKYAFNARM